MQRPLFFVFSVLLWTFSLPSFGQSAESYLGAPEYLSELLKKAETDKPAFERSWLILGHYVPGSKHWIRYESEVDGPAFFLSPLGPTDPEAELRATLKAFFEPLNRYADEKDHPQCRFLARRGWVLERFQIDPARLKVLPCRFHQDWKKRLNAERISMIFAASYMNNPSSMFGHTFMKFHTRGQSEDQDLLNYGLNFAATTGSDGGMAFMIKGLFGGYPGEFSLSPYYLKLLDYSNVEGRDIWEYELSLTPEEIDRLIDHLFELEQSYFDYYFFSENCSYQLLGLLEWARPGLHLKDRFFYHVIPADTIRLLAQQPGLIRSVRFRPALRQNLEGRLQLLSSEETKMAQNFFEDANVSALVSSIADRPVESQARILDAAMAFGALKEFKNREEWKEPLFQLQSRRAQLGQPSPRLEIHSALGPPHEAHPPARLSVGGGYQDSGGGFANLGFRFAYHELTDSDVGLLSGSQIQSFYFQTRWFEKQERLEFVRFRLFDIVSLSPWGTYQKPLSWKAALGYENTFGEDAAFLSGGVGSSFDLTGSQGLVLAGLLQTELSYQKELPRSHYWGVGPAFLMRTSLHPNWRLLVQAQSLWNTRTDHWSFSSQTDFSYNWKADRQIHLRFKSKSREQVQDHEVMLVWESFFLL